jgi:uncharacterized protein YuzE
VKLSYDKDADVLYITFEPLAKERCIYVENERGDILRLNKETKRVVGCTIMAFSRRASETLIIPEIGSVPFNELAAALVSE